MATRAVKYHNLKAAADLLSCSVSQVYNYIAADRIVAVKMDGKTLISDEEKLSTIKKRLFELQ